MTAPVLLDLPAITVAEATGATVLHDLDTIDRPEWLSLRKSGLGGSDAAAILGVSPWTSGYTLWLDKNRTDSPDDQATLAMRRGTHLETFILTEAMNVDPDLTVYRAPYMLAHPDHPHLRANLDGLAHHVKRRTWGGVEAKNVNAFMAKHWADGPPAYYEAQVGHYLACCPLIDWWAVVADFGGDDLRVFYLDRESVPVETIVERELAWWQRHMVDGVAPDPDGHAATTDAMKAYEPAAPEQTATVGLAEVQDVFARIAEARAMGAMATEAEDAAKNELRLLMAEASVLTDEADHQWATWRQGKDKTETNWQAVAIELAGLLAETRDGESPDDVLAATAQIFTTTKPGPRVLRVDAGLKNLKETTP